jgi:benzoyl-CoA reductase/2-hydroxyglutaryl-CoA dehydratase subunit BcrC/BadD/HgdB
MKEWLDIPLFDLDLAEDATDVGRRRTRLEAFMEMLR